MKNLQDPPRPCFLPKRRLRQSASDPYRSGYGAIASLTPDAAIRERLAALPGIQAAEQPPRFRSTTYFLDSEFTPGPGGPAPYAFCRCDSIQLLLYSVAAEDRIAIQRSRWGRASGESMVVYAPRDAFEVQTAWRIVLMAYRHVTTSSSLLIALRRHDMHRTQLNPEVYFANHPRS